MKKLLFSCLLIVSVCAQEEINPVGTKAQEQMMPLGKSQKAPENTPISKIEEPSRYQIQKEIKSQPSEDNPLQKKLAKQPGPFEKFYWEYHHSASLGLRRDRQKFADSATKQMIENRNTLQLILGTHLEVHHMVFQMRGQYGWLVRGENEYLSRGGPKYPGGVLFHSNFKLGGGYTADLQGAAGVRIELYSNPKFDFSFLPSAGYKYSHVKNFSEGLDRNSSLILLNSPGFIGFSQGILPKPNQQDWFGPFLEGRVEFRFWEKLNFNLYYQFHWTALRSKNQELLNLSFSNPNSPTTPIVEYTLKDMVYKSRINYGQLGGVYLRYISEFGLDYGFLFEGISVYSTTAPLTRRIREDFLAPVPSVVQRREDARGSIHWVNYQVSIFLGHQW